MNEIHYNIKRILLIEQNPELMRIIEHFLTVANYAVYRADNIPKAVKLISSAEDLSTFFDAFIISVECKSKVIRKFIEKVKEIHPPAPIIAITGSVSFPKELALLNGADDVLYKPFPMEQLLESLDRVVISQYKEKRFYNRFNLKFPVTFEDISLTPPHCSTHTKNISIGGMFIPFDGPLDVGGTYPFQICFSQNYKEVIMGRIVWTTFSDDHMINSGFGVNFLEKHEIVYEQLILHYENEYGL